MLASVRRAALRVYERLLESEIEGVPTHVAVIQDGNRRFAREQGEDPTDGHRAGAETTEAILEWCDEVGVRELTLYAFSTENFERPPDERAVLFDLIESKLLEFADHEEVHENRVRIRAIGETHRLPERVRDAIATVERRTAGYDRLHLNVALAYGGREELLNAARASARAVADGDLAPGEIDVEEIERRLYEGPTRAVDLIIRTGGDERTSNFLPWHANGNEAAVFFCTPYWPEFRRIDFLRAIRTYESRRESWRRTRARRALALVRAVGDVELQEARRVLGRFRDSLSTGELDGVAAEGDGQPAGDSLTESNAGNEAIIEGEPGSEPDHEPDAESEADPEVDAEPEADPEVDAEPEAEPEADHEPEPEPEADHDPEPDAESGPIRSR